MSVDQANWIRTEISKSIAWARQAREEGDRLEVIEHLEAVDHMRSCIAEGALTPALAEMFSGGLTRFE